MLRAHLLAVAALSIAAACEASHSSKLDGAFEYKSYGGYFGGTTMLHVDPDGSAVKQETPGYVPDGDPSDPMTTTTSGTVMPDLMAMVRSDVAAVDLGDFEHGGYDCSHYQCGYDGGIDELHIDADGKTYQIEVDQNISWSNLPSGLTKLIQDMHLVSAAIH
ncbi:MAG TPA: hypothetical protein VIX73_28050 [Kofleriaceae bacterium]|jgi:hypothetical protein